MLRYFLYKGFSLLGQPKVLQLEQLSKEPRLAQEHKLLSLIRNNTHTSFGVEHSFSRINSIAHFQSAVPIRDYEGFRPYINKIAAGESKVLTNSNPFMFATTSGTTGQPKLIPVTQEYLEEFRQASVVSGYNLLKHFPAIAKGVTLAIASPAKEGCSAGGIPFGAISGQLYLQEPSLIRKFIAPIPYEVYLIRDYESRYYTLLRLALTQPLTCLYTLNPSTIALLMRKLKINAEQLIEDIGNGTINTPLPLPDTVKPALAHLIRANPKRAQELYKLHEQGQFVPWRIWPKLQVICCWTKAAAAFYLSDFPNWFGQIPICDITYGASEGRGTAFIAPGKQTLSLQSHFFEFIPEDQINSSHPKVYLADELIVGQNYYILFTTSAGLYRYHINDVVKVCGFFNRTPLIEFQYKGGNTFSFTGEKITELQVTETMSSVISEFRVPINFFSVIPKFRPEPHYEIWLEFMPYNDFALDTEVLNKFSQTFDHQLAITNIEYAAKRESSRLGPPIVKLLIPGSYELLRKQLTENGAADSQIKISHLNPKEEVQAFLKKRLQDLSPCPP